MEKEEGRGQTERREGKLCSIGYVVFIGEREGDAHVVARKRMKIRNRERLADSFALFLLPRKRYLEEEVST